MFPFSKFLFIAIITSFNIFDVFTSAHKRMEMHNVINNPYGIELVAIQNPPRGRREYHCRYPYTHF